MRSSRPWVLAGACVIAGSALALAGCDAVLGPSRLDGDWRVDARARFTFHTRPGSFCDAHVDTFNAVLSDQFAVTVNRLRLRYDGHVAIFLHSSGIDAGFDDDLGGGDHSGVAYPATETVRAACVPPLDGNLLSLLSHELNHVVIINGLGRAGTRFMNEGLASATLSEAFHSLGPTFYYRWVADRRGQLPRLADLVDDDRWSSVPQHIAYATSASFLAYLLETSGDGVVRGLYAARSAEFVQRFRDVFGRSLDEVEADWLAFCEARRNGGSTAPMP
jgi:hypothetical protein